MEYRLLCRSGLKVSHLCFGTLTLGPLQTDMPLEAGAEVLAHAIRLGVNFADTAQLYLTYPYIRQAMKLTGRYDLVVSTKTYAYTAELAHQAVEEARRELNRDYIDIFMLHEQESIHTLRGHMEAAEYLLNCKARGIIKAVGVSAHHIAAVEGALSLGIYDVVHPILNCRGLGIADGTLAAMESAVQSAHSAGMGVLAMKVLGGGNLYRNAEEALTYALEKHYIDSIAIGMQTPAEVERNIAFFEQGVFPAEPDTRPRRLHIEAWCEGCGRCMEKCHQNALRLTDGTLTVEREKCLRCGYCSSACPAMALKML